MKYEKWSFGYNCLKQYVRVVDWIIHKETIVTGRENIPKDKPILFAPNHQNALSDPMAILLHTQFQPVWLARADIFKKGIITFLLRFLKIMPVYRMRDGKNQLAKNDKTFADSIKVLENNFALALFPEAAHSSKRQMLAHKKAVPRIVFMAEEKANSNLNIHIVPVGIYYSSYWKFNRTVIVNFGKPILANDFLEEFENNVTAATLALRDDIYNAIEPLTLNIKSKNHYTDFELIREIYGKHFLRRQSKKHTTLQLFKSDQLLIEQLDKLENENARELEKVIATTKTYDQLVRKYKLRSWLIEKPSNNFLAIGLNKLILLAGLPLFVFGFIFNAIPFFTLDTITRKKIKDHAFWSTFFLAGGMILFPIAYLLELWAVSPFLPGAGYKLLFLAAIPLAGKMAFRWYIILLKTLGRARLLFMKLFNKRVYTVTKDLQTTLFEKMDNLIKP
jgi:1-acyl-sn-glycerol-3-phosphate acyltransferase